jgi:Tol biopolymer transport system component
VIVHPRLNLFLVGAKLEGDVTIYLGHVRKEGSLFEADMYRLQSFEQVSSPTFSRNGQVLLFATSEQGVEKVAMARLEDILSDINRRYPEAKLSLAALESEVK